MTNITSSTPIIDLTSATTLSINTTTNRPVSFGTGTVTIQIMQLPCRQTLQGNLYWAKIILQQP